MDHAEVAARGPVLAGCDRAEPFEVAATVVLPIELEHMPDPAWVRMDHGLHAFVSIRGDELVGVVGGVAEQRLPACGLNQFLGI